MRSTIVGVWAAAMLAAGGLACGESESETTICDRLHDHAVELVTAPPSSASSDEVEQLERHAAVRRRANRERALARCEQLSDDQIRCALAADSVEVYRACTEKEAG